MVGWLGGGREVGAERVWWMDGWMDVVGDRFMNAVEGRDGVGRRARGERMNDAFGYTYIIRVWMDHVGKQGGILLGEGFQLAGVFMRRENSLLLL